MITTIKIDKKTKDRLLSLDLSTKDKTFDIIINELITSYEKNTNEWKKSMGRHQKAMNEYENMVALHKKEMKDYEKEKKTWEDLLKWAKTKGFKA